MAKTVTMALLQEFSRAGAAVDQAQVALDDELDQHRPKLAALEAAGIEVDNWATVVREMEKQLQSELRAGPDDTGLSTTKELREGLAKALKHYAERQTQYDKAEEWAEAVGQRVYEAEEALAQAREPLLKLEQQLLTLYRNA